MGEDQGGLGDAVKIVHPVVTGLLVIIGALSGPSFERRLTHAEDTEGDTVSSLTRTVDAQSKILEELQRAAERMAVLESGLKRTDEIGANRDVQIQALFSTADHLRDRIEKLEVVIGALNGNRK